VASAIPQVDNKSVASQSEVALQVRSDVQDALDKAVQVSHTQDLPVPMGVAAIPQVDSKSAVSPSEEVRPELSDAQEIPAAKL
jgi:hypothetical protein